MITSLERCGTLPIQLLLGPGFSDAALEHLLPHEAKIVSLTRFHGQVNSPCLANHPLSDYTYRPRETGDGGSQDGRRTEFGGARRMREQPGAQSRFEAPVMS